MTLYIGGKSCDNQNDLNDLFSIVEKLPFQDCLYSRPLYIDFNKFYIINNNDIYEHNLNCGEPKKVELQDNILLIAEDSQHKEKRLFVLIKIRKKVLY